MEMEVINLPSSARSAAKVRAANRMKLLSYLQRFLGVRGTNAVVQLSRTNTDHLCFCVFFSFRLAGKNFRVQEVIGRFDQKAGTSLLPIVLAAALAILPWPQCCRLTDTSDSVDSRSTNHRPPPPPTATETVHDSVVEQSGCAGRLI